MNIQIKNNTMEQLKGIKLPLLVIDGCIDPFADNYVMFLYEKSCSFSTLETSLRQILLFYRYCNKHNSVLPVSLSSLKFFSGGRQLFNKQHGRLIVHNSRASICQDRGIVQRNIAAVF